MKTLITIILATLLAACGDCPPDAVIAPPEVVTVAAPEPIVTPPVAEKPQPPVITPVVEPIASPTKPEPVTYCANLQVTCLDECPWYRPCEPIQVCPQSTGCPPSPAQLPPSRIPVVEPNPTPACIRDNTPLVYIAPFWVDNCGNKYGQTS
jgi:hypothetical protein